jgi:thymidylate synthase ThyX
LSRFLSEKPQVILVAAFAHPMEGAMAAAKTCYSSKGVVLPQGSGAHGGPGDPASVGDGWTGGAAAGGAAAAQARAAGAAGGGARGEGAGARQSALAGDIYRAGHHTVFQHAHFQFALTNVSRLFVWSFLHSHPFYNSEQVSQRYVPVAEDSHLVPALGEPALGIYRECVAGQHESYRSIVDLVAPKVSREYFARFPSRASDPGKHEKEIRRKAQEAARYVLPLATFTYMHHTVSALTLFRYYRLCQQWDVPAEGRLVVQKMVEAALAFDPDLRALLQEPIPLAETPEFKIFASQHSERRSLDGDYARQFDRGLGGRFSSLVDYKAKNEETVAAAVREVLGLTEATLSDDEALSLLMDPARNSLLGETLNLTTMSKVTRSMWHAAYTFRKKLSHSADSQDQRHRMTPASRPSLVAAFPESPDCLTPSLIAGDDRARAAFDACIEKTWSSVARLRELGVPRETAQYLLPNAVAVRFTESADLLSLRHKMAMRLCYNSQEEIWRAALDEAVQVREINPRLGAFLLPPCALRDRAGVKPVCPEGKRFCGVKVWRLDLAEYDRVI